ncbi:hypothetical protein JD969_20235 [Planctomycetota bacterium]|nr:hypothetical protein JD969_20235 [Planctomycetota bacterium]
MSSVIKLVCPNLQCRKILSVPTHARGKNVRCRACGIRVTVPGKKKSMPVAPQSEEQIEGQTIEQSEVTDQTESETV